jgi:hypothetical protein
MMDLLDRALHCACPAMVSPVMGRCTFPFLASTHIEPVVHLPFDVNGTDDELEMADRLLADDIAAAVLPAHRAARRAECLARHEAAKANPFADLAAEAARADVWWAEHEQVGR